MNKFEKLIEYVINNEDAKAEELFHEIVVEKSRDIYESLMDSDEEMGGDNADNLISDIEADEEGVTEADEDEEGFGGEESEFGGEEDFGGEESPEDEEAEEEDLEDRVVDLEDQLDALMAEFDSIVNGGGDMDADDMGGDEFGGEEGFGGEDDMEEEPEMEGMFNENVSLTKVTKGIANSTEESTVNKKSVNADNSGKKGMQGKPQQSSGEENGRTAPPVKDGNGTTQPNQQKVKEPKKTGEEAGVNTKSIES